MIDGAAPVTRMLASVATLDEARSAAACGADIIDLKNPLEGALGALPRDIVATIVSELKGAVPISATIGDLPMQPERVRSAVEAMATTGVDYIKLGCFPGGDWPGVFAGLRPLTARGVRLVAVLFADHSIDLSWLPELARSGFAGAMLDTADKQAGALTTLRSGRFLREFVDATQRLGLLCGLAGSLRVSDIAPLCLLGPDYLGFRGALCGGLRTEALDPAAVSSVLAHLRNPPSAV